MSDVVASWLRDRGLVVDRVELDGKIHRVDGAKRGKAAGWYIGWTEPLQVCVAGDWSTGEKWTWKPAGKTLTRAERAQVTAMVKAAVARVDDTRAEEQAHTARRATELWNRAGAAPHDHPYLIAKGVAAGNARASGEVLYVPAIDSNGRLWGVQCIMPSGRKSFLKGQRVAGTFCPIGGEPGGRAFICEGFATGMSIAAATGCFVVCAFAANNLRAVATAMRERFKDTEWIVAGDDDHGTKHNAGRTNAERAAEAIGSRAVFPCFPPGSEGTDFNDLQQQVGLDAVRAQLMQTGAEVVNLADERRRRGKKNRGDELSQAELHRLIARKIDRDASAPEAWPPFPRRFHVFADEFGRRAVLEEVGPGIVAFRDDAVVTSAILDYVWNHIPFVEGADLSHRAASAAKCLWLDMTKPMNGRPMAIAEASTPGLTFRRLAFDAPPAWPDAPPPHFAEFLSRCSQPQALSAFIGSLFYPEADRQQYLYIYGQGLDGKGSLLRMLFELFGRAAQSLQPKSRDDRFWNMKVYGKRLVMFPDCEDFRFFASPEFKSLTGNDPLFFEEKGKPGFSDIPTCKIIAASNHRPVISSQRSDLRRLIYVEVAQLPEGVLIPNYERLLHAEAEQIVRLCKATYLEAAPNHGPIECEPPHSVAFEAEGDYLSIFEKYFVEAGEEYYVTATDVRDVLMRCGITSNVEQRKVKDAWQRVFNVLPKHTRHGTRYCGMRRAAAPPIEGTGDGRDGR